MSIYSLVKGYGWGGRGGGGCNGFVCKGFLKLSLGIYEINIWFGLLLVFFVFGWFMI